MPSLRAISGTKNKNGTETESSEKNYDLEDELTLLITKKTSSVEVVEMEILELDKMEVVDEEESVC